MPKPTRLDLESRLFGILQTLKTIHKDIQKGKISYISYCSTVRRKINDIMLLELAFRSKGLKMDEIIEHMNISDDFFKLIPQIQEFITRTDKEKGLIKINEKDKLKFTENQKDEEFLKPIPFPAIKLANLASEITASFITIFDFFKLDMKDPVVLEESFERLSGALQDFPGMGEIYLDTQEVIRNVRTGLEREDKKRDLLHDFETQYRRFLAILKQPSNL